MKRCAILLVAVSMQLTAAQMTLFEVATSTALADSTSNASETPVKLHNTSRTTSVPAKGEGDVSVTKPVAEPLYQPLTDVRVSTFHDESARNELRTQVGLVASLVAAALATVCLIVTVWNWITIHHRLASSCRHGDWPDDRRCSDTGWKSPDSSRQDALVSSEFDAEKGYFHPVTLLRSPQTERVMCQTHGWPSPQYPEFTRVSPLTRRDTDISQLSGQTCVTAQVVSPLSTTAPPYRPRTLNTQPAELPASADPGNSPLPPYPDTRRFSWDVDEANYRPSGKE